MIPKNERIAKPIIKVNGQTYYHSEMRQSHSKGREPFISTDGQRMNEVAAADYVGLSIKTLQNRRSKRVLPSFHKSGRSVIYLKTDLNAFLKQS
jgi:hypothetical protein